VRRHEALEAVGGWESRHGSLDARELDEARALARLIAGAGLLVAADRDRRDVWALKRAAAEDDVEIVVPAPILAQVWRGAASAGLARLVGLRGGARPGAPGLTAGPRRFSRPAPPGP